jgi:RimJ/RimL family protein N-acetyltransferase
MVSLRQAEIVDAAPLYRWRIDADTVRHSLAPPPASLDEHRGWLEALLREPAVALYVAHDDERGVDVGTVRLDRRGGGEAEMSITVAPDERGRGYARQLIARGLEAAAGCRVIARVKADNLRSLRAFAALGFATAGSDDGLVRLVHAPAAAGPGANA